MKEVSLKELLEAGCHFGHQTARWNPKMKPYIFAARDRIHIFDLVKTKEGLEKAATFAKETAAAGGQIVFIGTKRQAQEIVREAAKRVNMPYITERWIGGLITNWGQIKKRLDYLADLKAGKKEGRFSSRTKKENLLIDRELAKLERIFGGITSLKNIPAAIFVTDARKDLAALKEAKSCGVPTLAIADTNANPDLIDYLIPANDDAVKCLQLLVGVIAEAIEEGLKQKSSPAAEAPEKENKPVAAKTKTVAKALEAKKSSAKTKPAK